MKLHIFMILACALLFTGCESKKNMAKQIRTKESKCAAATIGVTHVTGRYHFTNKDFLNEGADQILDLGSRVIKVWFYGSQKEPAWKFYPYNSNWPRVKTLVDGAKTPYFKALFEKPFATYILSIWSMGRHPNYWQKSPITPQQEKDEQRQFYEFTKYLLTTYKGTGKTFVLQNHEGDWHLRDSTNANQDPNEQSIASMIKWLNARQRGVNQARAEVGQLGVHVYHAAEVCVVVKSLKEGRPNMVNRVIPHTKLDLISYSAWDSTVGQDGPELLRESLDYIAANMPDSDAFGNKNVYIGEFGLPANEHSPEQVLKLVKLTVETARNWECPYIVYWQLYCNELSEPNTPVPVKDNKDVRGFWLIRPDGSKSPVWDYFHNIFQAERLEQTFDADIKI